MKFIISLLLALILSSSHILAYSQVNRPGLVNLGKTQTVDTSFLECVYEHCTHDPILNETRIDDEILEIGRKASRYGSYPKYIRDSIIATDYPTGICKDDYDK